MTGQSPLQQRLGVLKMLISNFYFQLVGILRSGQDKIWFRRKPLLKRFVILAALNIAASANPISAQITVLKLDWRENRTILACGLDQPQPSQELIEGCGLEPSGTNSSSLATTSYTGAKGIVGKKEDIGNRTLNPDLNGQLKWFAISIAFVAILAMCGRFIYGLAQATFIHQKKCEIPAILTTDFAEFDGDIVILGKLGCRFAPKNMDSLDSIKALLGPTEFHRFSISTDKSQRPVFVNAVENTQVPVFFSDRLRKSELEALLQLSTVKVQYASWRPAKTGPRTSKEVISARLKRLADLRDEEIRRKQGLSSD